MDLSKIFFGLNNEYYLFPKQNILNFDNVIIFSKFSICHRQTYGENWTEQNTGDIYS
jgi:hypothetical protein